MNYQYSMESLIERYTGVSLFCTSVYTHMTQIYVTEQYLENNIISMHCSACDRIYINIFLNKAELSFLNNYMSHIMRKPAFCICENKDVVTAAQLISAFVYATKIVPSCVVAQPGSCLT